MAEDDEGVDEAVDEGTGEEASVDELLDALRSIELAQFLVSTISTLASLAYGKLDSGNFEEARLGIDAMRALVPVLQGHVEDALRRDLEQAVANLQVAYANAVSQA